MKCTRLWNKLIVVIFAFTYQYIPCSSSEKKKYRNFYFCNMFFGWAAIAAAGILNLWKFVSNTALVAKIVLLDFLGQGVNLSVLNCSWISPALLQVPGTPLLFSQASRGMSFTKRQCFQRLQVWYHTMPLSTMLFVGKKKNNSLPRAGHCILSGFLMRNTRWWWEMTLAFLLVPFRWFCER